MKAIFAVILLLAVVSCAAQPKPAPVLVQLPEPPIPPVARKARPARHKLTPLEKRAYEYVLSPDATPDGIQAVRDILNARH